MLTLIIQAFDQSTEPTMPTTVTTDQLTPGDEVVVRPGSPHRVVQYVHPRIDGTLTVHFHDGTLVPSTPTDEWERVSTVESRRSTFDPPVLGRLFVTLFGDAREDLERVQRAGESTFADRPDARLEVTERYEVPADVERGLGPGTRWTVTAYGAQVTNWNRPSY